MRNLLFLLIVFFFSSAATAQPVGTRFTYQGELRIIESPGNAVPGNGEFDFTFTLFDDESNGTEIGVPIVAEDVTVIDGIFTVELDFGIEPFTGDQLWLRIEVRNGTDTGAFTELLPRHALTAAPFAVLAEKVSAGSVGALEVLPSEVQLRVAEACPTGSALRAIAEDGGIICEIDSDEQSLTLTDLSLAISNGNEVDLSGFLDNTDAQTLSLDLDTTSLIISGGNAVNLSTLFNDNDPSNELNTAVSFDGANLNITDAGGTLSADLSALSDSAAEALAKLITVDGVDSGLDADLLDGLQASEIIAAASQDNRTPISSLPFAITAPGSYIVTQDLINTVDDTNGISVQASHVTIDLGGFRLSADMSPDDSTIVGRRGIFVAGGNTDIHVLNGHIDNWGSRGIDASACTGCMFERLIITNSRLDGIEAGASAVISQVTASFNGDSGFVLGNGTVVALSKAQANGEHGFASELGSSNGLGISIINSSAFENAEHGFELDDGATVIAASAFENLGHGFSLFGSSTVQESSAYDNGFNGFDVESSMLRDNVAAQNGSEATNQNSDNGFRASSDSYLINNHAWENDGAGIRVTSSDVVIEQNTAIDNDRAGIESRVGDGGTATTGSLYIRNRAAGNSNGNNFDIAAGNSFGPIVDVDGVGDLSTIANADHPMANFEY